MQTTQTYRRAGSVFTLGLGWDGEPWLGSAFYCNAMEPLLRLAARDTDRFGDLTGSEDKPQARRC